MSARSLYPTSGSTEPDMRRELKNTLKGHYPEISKAQKVLFRKMRKDASNELMSCPCVDSVTDEPDRDTFCPVCHGEGYVWDETYIDCYKIVLRNELIYKSPVTVFYCDSSLEFTDRDKIVELVLNTEGKVIQPIRRRACYKIEKALDFRGDNGRLEYWKLDCFEKFYKFLNGIQI